MTWVVVALTAYFILAVANLLDKFLIDNVLLSSKAYAFAACILGLIIFLIAPWFLHWPGLSLFILDLLAGFIFAVALWMLYEALQRGEASRILVTVGGTTPIFSLIFSILFFKEQFSNNQLIGISLLLIGVFVIAILPKDRTYLSRVLRKLKMKQNIKSGGLLIALLSAFSYSLYFICTKYVYSFQPFLSAFIWTRLGAAILVSFFLLSKNNRYKILHSFTKKNKNKRNFLVVVNQVFGSLGFVLQNYAIYLGSVTIVNALQGVQYAFLLIISAIIALLAPKLLKETFSWPIVLQKTAAVIIIGTGLYFLAS